MVTSGLKWGCAEHPSGSKMELIQGPDVTRMPRPRVTTCLFQKSWRERDTQNQVLLVANDRVEGREARRVNAQCKMSVEMVTQTHPLATVLVS